MPNTSSSPSSERQRHLLLRERDLYFAERDRQTLHVTNTASMQRWRRIIIADPAAMYAPSLGRTHREVMCSKRIHALWGALSTHV